MRVRGLVVGIAFAATVLGLSVLFRHDEGRNVAPPARSTPEPSRSGPTAGVPGRPAAPPQDVGRVPVAAQPDEEPADRGLTVLVHDAGSERGRAGVRVLLADVDLLPEMRAFDELVELVGLSAITDASGRARLPMPVGEFRVVAHAAERFGRASRRDLDPAAGSLTIALLPDPALEVRAHEASGAPAAGVRVGLVSRREGFRGWLEEWATSAADGRLVLHPGRAPGKELFVQALIESPEPVEVPLDETAPVTITLPPCGRVEVRAADAEGRPEARELPVLARFLDDESLPVDAGRAGNRPLVDGHATLSHVVAGAPFQVRVGDAVSEALTLAAGETRTVTLTRPIGTRVTVRLVDPRGAPLAHALVRAFDRVPGSPVSATPGETLRCDARGVLAWNHREREAGAEVERVLATAGRFREPLTARVAYRVTAGTVDLGELALAPEALLVGGVVVDDVGDPVPGAGVTCGLLPAGARDPLWRPDLTAITDARGRFAIHSAARVPALRLAFDRPEHVPVRDLAVAPGTADLRVVLARGGPTGAIVGHVLVEGGSAALEAITVHAHPVGENERFDGLIQPWPGSSFEIPRLPPGEHAVEVIWNLRGLTRRLRTIAPVHVAAGDPTRDPRLEPVDLRGALRAVELSIVRPGGDRVAEAHVTLLDATIPAGEPGHDLGTLRLQSPGGTHRLVLPAAPIDLEARGPGSLPARVGVTGSPLRVELPWGPEITLAAGRDDAPALRPSIALEVTLQPKEPRRSFREPVFVPWGRDGASGLRAGEPGPYRVLFRYILPEGDSGEFPGPAVEVGEAPAQVFEVVLPAPGRLRSDG